MNVLEALRGIIGIVICDKLKGKTYSVHSELVRALIVRHRRRRHHLDDGTKGVRERT